MTPAPSVEVVVMEEVEEIEEDPQIEAAEVNARVDQLPANRAAAPSLAVRIVAVRIATLRTADRHRGHRHDLP
jgi:hypothetical protein